MKIPKDFVPNKDYRLEEYLEERERETLKDKVVAYVERVVELGQDSTKECDESYLTEVEKNLGLTDTFSRYIYRENLRQVYTYKVLANRNYDFMDDELLVKAVAKTHFKKLP